MGKQIMEKLTDFRKIHRLMEQINAEKVYPLSILEGYQRGEIFVDDMEAPTASLIWHSCGFANILGDYDQGFVEEVITLMQHPPEGHAGRLILQAEQDDRLQGILMQNPMIKRHERYVFTFAGHRNVLPHRSDPRPEPISSDNYDLLRGRIVPTFSWQSKEAFLQNGFGYCMIDTGHMVACAFSSGISHAYVDIGVETSEEYRGNGYGRIIAETMVSETLRRGKVPVWECDVRNEASMRLARSVGFEIVGTHPWYAYEK